MESTKKWLRSWVSKEVDESQSLDRYTAHRKFKVNGELYIPGKKAKEKICIFVDCEFTFDIHNKNSNAIKINNLLYDPDQENDEFCLIPINSGLEFYGYVGHDMDGKELRGFCFYNKRTNYLFQLPIEKEEEAEQLEYYTVQLLFEAKTDKDFTSTSKTELIKYSV